MTSTAPLEIDMAISLVQQKIDIDFVELATGTMIIYEHMITFPDEIRLIWSHRAQKVNYIFLVVRYSVLAYGIIMMLGTRSWGSALSCETDYMLLEIGTIALYAIIAGFSALRTYAVSGCKWQPALVTLILGLVPVVTNIYLAVNTSYSYVTYVGGVAVCNYETYYSRDVNNQYVDTYFTFNL